MENKSRRYIVKNTTIKPAKIGPDGRDTRKLQEKNGYTVQFKDHVGSIRAVSPQKWGGNPVIVSEITEGLITLLQSGLVEVKQIDDITANLKKHTFGFAEKEEAEAAEEGEQTFAGIPETPKKEVVEEPRKAKATPMGEPAGKTPEELFHGAVNPDGKDNFTVVAPSGHKKKKKRDL